MSVNNTVYNQVFINNGNGVRQTSQFGGRGGAREGFGAAAHPGVTGIGRPVFPAANAPQTAHNITAQPAQPAAPPAQIWNPNWCYHPEPITGEEGEDATVWNLNTKLSIPGTSPNNNILEFNGKKYRLTNGGAFIYNVSLLGGGPFPSTPRVWFGNGQENQTTVYYTSFVEYYKAASKLILGS
jgi:hypothetical protein